MLRATCCRATCCAGVNAALVYHFTNDAVMWRLRPVSECTGTVQEILHNNIMSNTVHLLKNNIDISRYPHYMSIVCSDYLTRKYSFKRTRRQWLEWCAVKTYRLSTTAAWPRSSRGPIRCTCQRGISAESSFRRTQ